ncbi:Lrp/AsnC ligand binding domain-containing protein [Methanosarcinaceae archaeon]|nr:Lrp/AsnC ligand binding domain-containing protein [Methanosarcinaceae archaeon]MBQ3620621.1 Lrp/AsnC ligand binding domain-containing protein [Methanosarcinaceae archaeon]
MVVGVTMLNVLPGKEKDVYEKIGSYEGIKDVYHVFGEFDFVVVISTETLKQLNDLVDRIRGIPDVTATQTIIGADI